MLAPLDWLVIGVYVVFALGVGVAFARRAGQSVDEYFLSGRRLPWWIAGTSMIATSFAADTPLLITGWVREDGIWKNWAWWCFAVSGLLQVFLFARWWRRGGVMTKAELVELRYGGHQARLLRGFLGVLHAGFTNTIVLAWVMLAAAKIIDVLFGVDELRGLALASAIALSYSLSAGFWGVVVTDVVQFAMAMAGAIVLAAISWHAIDGGSGLAAALASGAIPAERLAFLPRPADLSSGSLWTSSLAAFAVYLGVSWWAVENVDGSGIAVQRIAASRDERAGMLATLWFNFGHYALRPWCWIPVALASLVVLPTLEVRAPHDAVVRAVERDAIELEPAAGGEPTRCSLVGASADWRPIAAVEPGERVPAGALLARTDPERAYVVMMLRYLPVGLLGLVAASLLAAFMSTVDTHVNLAASFFVNDVYRRFLRAGASARHYVVVARLASAAVLLLAGLFASRATSLSALFLFFLAFLGGVGPVYVARWFWWRVRASTEIAAMLASAVTTLACEAQIPWPACALAPAGELTHEGRLLVVVAVSLVAATATLLVARAPDPRDLVPFYRRVRPIGRWGPVRALCPDVEPPRELALALVGTLGALAATYGTMLGIGFAVLGRRAAALGAALAAVVGAVFVLRTLARLSGAPAGSAQAEPGGDVER